MEGIIFLAALVVIGAFVLSIIVGAQLLRLKSRVEELTRRLTELESRKSAPAAQPVPPRYAIPPPLPDFLKPPPTPPPPKIPESPQRLAINWESILGVKLFAWIGGFALFLGVVFLVKYTFENNWITVSMRVIAGAITGASLIIIGAFPALRRYRVPAQSLCATGVLILYADTYAAHSFYNLIPLSAATALTWIITGATLLLATCLNAQSAAWLGVFGGFLTPILLRTNYDNPAILFDYIGVLNCGIAAASALKRWNHLILLAAIGSVVMEFTWAADFFGKSGSEEARVVFLVMQALFLGICVALRRTKSSDSWTVSAAAVVGFAPLLAFIQDPQNNFDASDCGFGTLMLSAAGLIALAAVHRQMAEKSKGLATIVGLTLAFTCLAEWSWVARVFFTPGLNDAPLYLASRMNSVIAWHAAIFLLFAATPYLCGAKRAWPWMVAAVSGPLQFWFVHLYLTTPVGLAPGEPRLPHNWRWLLPLAFALPALIGVVYLVKRQHVDLASGDSRLATQGAAILTFVSLIFPVQFEREWITLGWAIEGLALILLFRWIPNRRLRAAALIMLCAAAVRLVLNPAVLAYHPRSRVPIWNWYLYAYGVSALCFFLSGQWFGDPREKRYERGARPLVYSLAGIVTFLLVNIEIADYFSIGPTLTFSFSGNFARDMTYTIAWAVFAFGLLVIGIAKSVRPVRLAAIALLCLAFAKLFLHDLDSLSQLYRIGAFVTVAIIAIVASFAYQRFLSPGPTKT